MLRGPYINKTMAISKPIKRPSVSLAGRFSMRRSDRCTSQQQPTTVEISGSTLKLDALCPFEIFCTHQRNWTV